MMARRALRIAILVTCLACLTACSKAEHNFSQYPGFTAHFSAWPRPDRAADAVEQALLERYRPRLFIGPGQEGPISFYDDYIAQGRLYDGAGRLISDRVDRTLLNAHKEDPDVVFEHTPARMATRPVVFGRVDRAELFAGERFTFLTYHFVFRHSGLPAATAVWQRILLDLLADTVDWHQLDHYTAVTVVLDAQRTPLALITQQHNYGRSYLLGRDLTLPADCRPRIDAAIGSNEIYPHQSTPQRHRAVSFLTAQGARYLLTGKDKPFLAADDITDPRREIDYRLDFIPATDAFYVFQGYLGKRRWLPGRDGPPGADYNTLPLFKPWTVQLIAFNWREGDDVDLDDLLAFLADPSPQGAAFARLRRKFCERWVSLRKMQRTCADARSP